MWMKRRISTKSMDGNNKTIKLNIILFKPVSKKSIKYDWKKY